MVGSKLRVGYELDSEWEPVISLHALYFKTVFSLSYNFSRALDFFDFEVCGVSIYFMQFLAVWSPLSQCWELQVLEELY